MIEIKDATGDDQEVYKEFLFSIPITRIYATPEYSNFLSMVASGESHNLLAFKGGRIVGALSYFRSEHLDFGSVINSLPWYGSHGGCVLLPDADSQVRRVLLERYVKAVSAPDIFSATMILSHTEEECLDEYMDIIKPDLIEKRIGQVTLLPSNEDNLEEELLMVFRQKTRNLVRKSLKQGFTLEITDKEEAWDFLHETHTENMAAIGGKAKPWNHFIALRNCIPKTQRQLWVAFFNERPVAALLLVTFNRSVEYITPVIKQAYRSRQPLSFLIYHAMLSAVRNGFRFWQWGGTWHSQESVRHFKAGWGAVEKPYSYLINILPLATETAKNNLKQLHAAFPYYYLLPYSTLSEPA